MSELPEQLLQDPSLGLLVPLGTLLPMTVALRAKVNYLESLLQQQDWSGYWAAQQSYADVRIVCRWLQSPRSLLERNLSLDYFEAEMVKTMERMADALERWVCLVILNQQSMLEALPGVSKQCHSWFRVSGQLSLQTC